MASLFDQGAESRGRGDARKWPRASRRASPGSRSDGGARFGFVSMRPALVGVLAAGMLAACSGLAYADSLPDPAQRVVRAALSEVGVKVPGPEGHATPVKQPRAESRSRPDVAEAANPIATAGAKKTRPSPADPTESSQLHPPHDQPGEPPKATPAGDHAPDEEPYQGGTGTANDASDGASAAGTATADEASNGHSAAGSGNAGDHPRKPEDPGHQADEHRPTRPS
jgi:hypothetical protein